MVDKVQLQLGEYVSHGESQLIVRVRLDDKRDIVTAANVLGLTQAQFVRNVLVQAARAIIAEAKSEGLATR
jgi:uncharacterized protein (DUF1778 family)